MLEMKNKHGFTLVELMAVIVILAIIIAISVPVYNKVQKSINEKNYENKVKLIETAATKYAEDTHYETMYVDDLITSGYLDADNEKGEIFNNVTKEKINCYIVQVRNESGIYYAKLIEENYEDNGKCSSNISNKYNKILKIKMFKSDKPNEEITKENSYNWWTNADVILKPEVQLSEGQSIEKIEWYEGSFSKNPIDDNLDEENNLLVQTKSVLQQNYIVKVTLNDGKIYSASIRVYIDKIAPKFYKNDKEQLGKNGWVKEIKYNVKAYDNESGIYGYKLVNQNTECSTNKEEYAKEKISIKENGTYKICIMDNVGNVYGDIREINNIDNTPPAISMIQEKSHGSSYVDLNLQAQDFESGIEYFMIYYGDTSSTMKSTKRVESNNINSGVLVTTETSITGLTPGKTYFFRSDAYDNAGNYLSSEVISVKLCTWNTYYSYKTSKSTGMTPVFVSNASVSIRETSTSTGERVDTTKQSVYKTKYRTTAVWEYSSYTGTFTWFEDGTKAGGELTRHTKKGTSVWTSTLSGCYTTYGTGWKNTFSTTSFSVYVVGTFKQTDTYWIRTYNGTQYYTSWYEVENFNGGHWAYNYVNKGKYNISGTKDTDCGTSFVSIKSITNTTTLYKTLIIYSNSPVYSYKTLYTAYNTYDKNTSIKDRSYFTTVSMCEN